MSKALAIYPRILNLELTNICNLSCVFCDYERLKRQMEQGVMEDGLLLDILKDTESVVAATGNKVHELGLVGLGEPTLDTRLAEHLTMIGERSHLFERISFNSNLVSLSESIADLLLDSPISGYTFSVNASNTEMYRALMGRDAFERVIHNLRHFVARWKEKQSMASVAVQVFDAEGNSVEELRALVPEATDDISFFVRKVYSKPALAEVESGLNVLEGNEEERRYPCWDIYTRAYIDVLGNCYLCTIGNDCYREGCGLCVGNVADKPVSALYNSSKALAGRERAFRTGVAFPECEGCNVWSCTPNKFMWNRQEKCWGISTDKDDRYIVE